MSDTRGELPVSPADQPVTTYEYFCHYFGQESPHGEDFTGKMNALGSQGWQMVTVFNGTIYFMRVTGTNTGPLSPPGWGS